MRSFLFVPADSERKLAKALKSGADALILDLEDSVAPARKQAARDIAAAFLAEIGRSASMPALIVRINALASGLAEADLAATMPSRPDAILLPKSCGGTDLQALSTHMSVHEAEADIQEGATGIHVLATEIAAGLINAGTYANRSARLRSMSWGAEDLSADVGALSARDGNGQWTGVFALARTMTLLGAAAAGVDAVDAVYPAFSDIGGLEDECRAAVRDGFAGKLAIHPGQVEAINRIFTPAQKDIEAARRIVDGFAAAGKDAGVISLDGRMVDEPHRRLAERVLARARAAGATD